MCLVLLVVLSWMKRLAALTKPKIVFTATDADVIKTYAMGVALA